MAEVMSTQSNSFTLALASPHGDPASPKTWSGTPARLLAQFAPLVSRCDTLNYQLTPRTDFAMRATSRLFRGWNCCRNAWFKGAFERRFLERWRSLPAAPDACLHISDFCLPADLTGATRHFVYTDSALPGVAPYQPRPVRAGFLRDYRTLTRRYLERVSLVFTMNEWARQFYIAEHKFPADRVINVHFGINIAPHRGPKDFSRQLMLIVLRPKLEAIKGLDLMLAAWPAIRAVLPQAELAVVGTQVENPPPGVTCYFNQPREKTIELMQQATLFTMPALCEANGIVYPEALASRTPVLGLDRLAFPEFAGHGKYGFIVPQPQPEAVAETVMRAFADPARLQQMGEAGQQFVVEHFTWARTAQTMLTAMQAAVAHGAA
jgi:glycosyltransferase involved in cell wall biosynthesis